MAYLNVRERRIEAKLAYVGPELSGKATNFDALQRAMRDGRIGKIEPAAVTGDSLLALAWHPIDKERFRDCEVFVRVVAQRGPGSETRMQDVLHDADGVVVVLDASPSAQEKNKESIAAVRSALAGPDRARVPVVVQVNKSDLPNALPTDDVLTALDATTLRHVTASASRGVGVVETLELALNEVLAAMQADRDAPVVAASEAGQVGHEQKAGGHPLLAALRQVLQGTVREHVADLQSHVTLHMERLQNAARDEVIVQVKKSVEKAFDKLAVEVRTTSARKAIADLAESLTPLTTAVPESVAKLQSSVDGTTASLRTLTSRLDYLEAAHKQRSMKTDQALSAIEAAIKATHSSSTSGTEQIQARFTELIEELKKPKKSWFA